MLGIELYINDTQVDLPVEGIPMPINKQISDIQQPDTRQSDFTKTIRIPGSKANDQLFGNIFDLASFIENTSETNFNPDFDPNLKAKAVVYENGEDVFNGYAQLVAVRRTDNEGIEYDIVIYGSLAELFKSIGDSELDDLSFSEFDHEYSLANIDNSWDTSIIVSGSPVAFEYGNGYVYPLIDYGYSVDLKNFNINSLFPAIYAKEYIDKIFPAAGFVYDSDFFDSTFFKKLIIPFNGPNFKMSDSDINDRLYRATKTAQTELATTSAGATNYTIIFNDDSTGTNYDNSAQFDTANGIYTVGTGLQGTFNIVANLQLGARFVPDTSGVAVTMVHKLKVVCSIVKIDAAGVQTVLNSASETFSTLDQITTSHTWDTSDLSGGIYDGHVVFASGPVVLNETDTIRVVTSSFVELQTNNVNEMFQIVSSGLYMDGTYYFQVNTDSFTYNVVDNANYVEGMTIDMNAAVPQGIKQKDFLMSIIKMFNLYVQPDADVSNKLIIEPRDEYYLPINIAANVIDLSAKLDISKEFVINPMGLLDAKEYVFQYQPDGDYLNDRYQNAWNEPYGSRRFEITNDFIDNVKTIDVIFSATPSYGDDSSDRIIPRIVTIDENNVAAPTKGNIRILQYTGMKSSNLPWYINSDTSGQVSYSTYPYAGMLDDPYDPTVDLSWGVPAEIYYTNLWHDINYTNKNLVNNYYKRMLNEITDRNSKVIHAYFDLNSFDIKKMDFRKTYYFDREYFRLNRIMDYLPSANETTLCEFIQIREGLTFTSTITEATDVFQDDRKPRFRTSFDWGYNKSTRNQTVSGEDNRIASDVRGAVIGGDGNSVGEACHTVFISGIDNVIVGDVSGVVVQGNNNRIYVSDVYAIGCNGEEITEPGVYINGQLHEGWELLTSSKLAGFNKRVYLLDASGGAFTVYLPLASSMEGTFVTFKKIDSSANAVTIDANTVGDTIDGSGSVNLAAQYDVITIWANNDEYFIISQ